MNDRIQLLSPFLSNQIAAGEVVERPASVVKELIENSLDAGATQIKLILEKGGTTLIRIEDNGRGIHPDDMLLALAAHSTSKIAAPSDLAQISTLGFRGEALASIASVSRLTLTSCRAPHEALSVHVEGREMRPVVKPAAHPVGTSVEVKHLFFNTPARQKFLKSERSELLAIEEVLKRIVLMHPAVSFHMYHDHKCIKRYDPTQDFKPRIQQVLSRAFIDKSFYVDASITQMRLYGWLGACEDARSSHDQAHFYVNGRPLRDKVLMHAVRSAYGDQLFVGRYPSYVLFLECDPASVDVNVHPTKHEVRFREARLVHDFIVSTVQQSISPNTMSVPSQGIPVIPQRPFVQSPVFNVMKSAEFTLGKIVAVLSQSVVVLQKNDHLIAIDWQTTLIKYAVARFQQDQSSGGVSTFPLLEPITLPGIFSDETIEHDQALGFVIQCVAKSHYILREIPRCFQGVDCRTVDFANMTDIVASFAKAWAVSHPMDHQSITQTLIGCEAILGIEGIVARDYAPSDFL
jgi:DNA mismatch repair protein MutL